MYVVHFIPYMLLLFDCYMLLLFDSGFNVMFVTERVLNTVCAFNLDQRAAKHDITILREAPFFRDLNKIMLGWNILSDKGKVQCTCSLKTIQPCRFCSYTSGYVGINKSHLGGADCIAAIARKDMVEVRTKYSKTFWRHFNIARGECERVFGDFFHNKFSQLGKWPGKSQKTFVDFSANVVACIVLYNVIKVNSVEINK